MRKSSRVIIGFFSVSFLTLVWISAEAQTACPTGYSQHGDFCCNNDVRFERPGSAGLGILSKKFCQPQITGCQATGGVFCAAGTRNACCPAGSACGKGTALGWEVAVCVPPPPPPACSSNSAGYIGQTKDGKNVCCQNNEEAGPLGRGTNTPYCQPKDAVTCDPGENFIQGSGNKYWNEKRCCAAGTVPSRHPNGLPFCARSFNYTLTVTKAGAGSGTIAASTGENCDPTCFGINKPFNSGTVITLTATPAPGSTFTGWSGYCLGFGSCGITMNTNRFLTANFAAIQPPPSNPPPPPDLVGPAITFLSPVANGYVLPRSGSIRLGASALDVSGVAKITIGLSGQPLVTCDNFTFHNAIIQNCSRRVPVSQLTPGTLIAFTATDRSPAANANAKFVIVQQGKLLQTNDPNANAPSNKSGPAKEQSGPTIQFLPPLVGGYRLPASGLVTISVRVSDVVGLRRTDIYVNNGLIQSCVNPATPTTDICEVTLPVSLLSAGSVILVSAISHTPAATINYEGLKVNP